MHCVYLSLVLYSWRYKIGNSFLYANVVQCASIKKQQRLFILRKLQSLMLSALLATNVSWTTYLNWETVYCIYINLKRLPITPETWSNKVPMWCVQFNITFHNMHSPCIPSYFSLCFKRLQYAAELLVEFLEICLALVSLSLRSEEYNMQCQNTTTISKILY